MARFVYKVLEKIGLTVNGKFFDESTDVVLDFPYKDTILKASMSKEDTDKNDLRPDEPFLNEVIAKEEIDVLLDKKILVNAKKYSKDVVEDIDHVNEDDNLIIKGNNLLALHTIKEKYAGKVKLIYIDPPYNTGNDSFKYNDKFNRSTWLTYMKNRLEIAKELLMDDGSIYVQIDNNEAHYLKVLMDEIFGEKNFQREIIWVLKGVSGYKSMINNYVRGHDTILFYSKSETFTFNKQYLPYSQEQLKRFSKIDENGRRYKPITKTRRIYLDEAKGIPISDVWDDIASPSFGSF
ncbi:site-specific DNA-methyltransferase [Virgibacillus sp. 179-BFC.A HS]|uniref:Site-specific DNA-methyltransferase n=1 Tax=Tigheibacillus jepli TaxID=3035914 RepID=A0ABU5CJL7_9BACI|nr:site-specific DNA-methyltransferase [Virgibacillus sp. 179-BFC.A HS]MDY0406509.1 site-specific DNA-methyltransferase [Virgibacillus sp. 179-BFC.A HS]